MIQNLSFKIKSVSIKGLVTILFNEPVFEFADLNSEIIEVETCVDMPKCAQTKIMQKPWVEIYLIAGESSKS